MVAKKDKERTRKVKSLRAKTLTAKQENVVKGGDVGGKGLAGVKQDGSAGGNVS